MMLPNTGFFSDEEAQAHARARLAVIASMREGLTSAEPQTSPVARAANPYQAASPTWNAYRVAIPEGWTVLQPVFYPVPAVPRVSETQDSLAAALEGFSQFLVGVLLCRPGADGQAARQECEAGALLEAAFLCQDGQYLHAAQVRPAYGVVPLAGPSPIRPDQTRPSECLVLLPCLDSTPGAARDSVPEMMMFVDGFRVQWEF